MNYQFGAFILDTINFRLQNAGKEVAIEPQVFDLLIYLIKHRERLVSRQEIFDNIWAGREVCDTTLSNHIKSARKVLGDDGRSQKVIKTIHGRGYQFIGQIHPELQTPDYTDSLPKPKFQQSSLITLSCIVLVTLIFFIVSIVSNIGEKSPNNYRLSIAVLPLTNIIPSENSDYFGFALADQIIGDFAYFKNLTVRPSSSIRQYAGQVYNVISVGNDLNVDFVLSGNYTHYDDTIRVNLELIDIKSNKLLWRLNQFEVAFSNTFKLQDIIAKQVISGLKIEFSDKELSLIKNNVPSNTLAYEYYFRSISYPLNIEGNNLAMEMLKKSISLDKNYAPAYVQLGNRVRRLEQYGLVDTNDTQSSESYYLKALSLNPKLLAASSYLSMYYTENNQIEKAIKLARQMQNINPNSATTHFTLGYIYRYAGLVELAIEAMEAAVEIDPKNPNYRSLIGSYSALGQYQKALEMTYSYPPSPFTLGWQALMTLHLGNKEQALHYFEQVIVNDPQGLWRQVAIVHKAYITNIIAPGLEAAHKLEQTQITDGETIYYNAAYYGLLNEKKRCLILLRKAIDSGYFNFVYIEKSSYFDSVRNEIEYKNIIADAKAKHVAFKSQFF